MQLFEKWQSVWRFLKYFCKANDTLSNAIFKVFDSACDRFSILVKTAESIEACERDDSKKKKN